MRGYTVLAMITTKRQPPWPGDHHLADWQAAGLHTPCLVRLKVFTLDNRLISRRIEAPGDEDRERVVHQLRALLPW